MFEDDDDWFSGILSDSTSNKDKRTRLGLKLPSIDKYTPKNITKKVKDDLVKNLSCEIATPTSWDTMVSKQTVDNIGSGSGGHGDLNLSGTLTVDGMDIGATLKTLQERFLILEADFEKHEQYPSLKDAYEKYKLVEKLLMDSSKK